LSKRNRKQLIKDLTKPVSFHDLKFWKYEEDKTENKVVDPQNNVKEKEGKDKISLSNFHEKAI